MAEPRDEALRRRYRELATEEPSVAIDDAIRAAARRAVSSAPGGVRRSASRRWAVPVSIAAVFFLSFGVVMQMEKEVPPLDADMRAAPSAASAPITPSVGSPPVPQVIPEELSEAESRAKAKEDGQKRRVETKAAVSTQAVVVPKPEPAPRALGKDLAAAPAGDARAQESLRYAAPAPKFVPPPPAPAEAAPAAAPAPAPAALADSMSRQAAPASPASTTAPAPPQSAAAPAAVRVERNEAQGRRDETTTGSLGIGLTGGSARAKAETGAAKPEAFAAKKATEAVTVDLAAQPWPDTPERKLERIEALRKAGRDREADEGIARFKREHPDYRIADDVWSRIKPR
ncbi:hypothetical protein BWI17_22385 [Betaproteobacteria bacterium GR16-43]|nr:hypothetical protein BWI17_22385 [Betaproteobacteria bacterium GR16-43]